MKENEQARQEGMLVSKKKMLGCRSRSKTNQIEDGISGLSVNLDLGLLNTSVEIL